MLEKLSRLAIRLHAWRPLLWVVFIGSLLTMSIQVFSPVLLEANPLFIPALICLLWSFINPEQTAGYCEDTQGCCHESHSKQPIPESLYSGDLTGKKAGNRLRVTGYLLKIKR
jgi:hypothetical protein